MYMFSAFSHSVELELAITDLERIGIAQEDILAVPLSKTGTTLAETDTIRRSDGDSILDSASALGTILMIFGVIYGFILPWGPIAWGLIGLLTGFIIGFLIDFFVTQKIKRKLNTGKKLEVILVINCDADQGKKVETVLNRHAPLGVAIVEAAEK